MKWIETENKAKRAAKNSIVWSGSKIERKKFIAEHQKLLKKKFKKKNNFISLTKTKSSLYQRTLNMKPVLLKEPNTKKVDPFVLKIKKYVVTSWNKVRCPRYHIIFLQVL